VLVVLVLLLAAFWPPFAWKQATKCAAAGITAYLLIMLPWLIRNLSEIGTPLPMGGTSTIWLRGYNELVNYPPGASAAAFWDWGWENILRSRWEALINNLGTFIAVETWVVLGPFVLMGLWQRRRHPFLLGVILYALGLHVAMTFVFAYPGYRGGLFHSSSALLPFWAAVGFSALDDGIRWMSGRRRWRKQQAQTIFGGALVVLAALLSGGVLLSRLADWNNNAAFYRTLADDLPDGAVLMINNPTALYYHTGLAGVVVPNANPDVVPEIAERYGVNFLVLDRNRTKPFSSLFSGSDSRPFLRLYKVYGAETRDDRSDDYRVYEIVLQEPGS
jgi:hypothetical protein